MSIQMYINGYDTHGNKKMSWKWGYSFLDKLERMSNDHRNQSQAKHNRYVTRDLR